MAFIDSKTVEYLTLLTLKQEQLPIVHRCSECGDLFAASPSAATDHGVMKVGTDQWTIVIGCEGWHTLAHVVTVQSTEPPVIRNDPQWLVVVETNGEGYRHPFRYEGDARHYYAECVTNGYATRLESDGLVVQSTESD